MLISVESNKPRSLTNNKKCTTGQNTFKKRETHSSSEERAAKIYEEFYFDQKWPFHRQKSAAQRKVILTEILRAVDQLSNDELILLFNFLFDDLDKRLLYFISVYLTSKKYIDFITLLPSNVVLKILAKVDPVTLNSLGHVSQAWRAQSKVGCPLA